MSEPRSQRTDIYAHNTDKANKLADSMNMSVTEMVNYLIESADVQQLTKITFEDRNTKKKFSTIRASNNYKPQTW